MKVKNKLFDVKVRRLFWEKIGKLELLLSLIFLFIEINYDYKNLYITVFLLILILFYFLLWLYTNCKNKINIKINGTEIEIKYGDIFEEKGKKIITFNEYFDTIVDNKIINEESINGQFIKQHSGVSKDELDDIIEEELKDKHVILKNESRRGKSKKYALGTTIKFGNDYLLTAFTKFNSENNAEITITEYMTVLIEIWKQIDKLYSQQIIVSPLLGDGTTRIKDKNLSSQELLEILLLTFKYSDIKLAIPSKLSIVLNSEKRDDINLYKVEEEYKNGI